MRYIATVLLLSCSLANASFGEAVVDGAGVEVNADISDSADSKDGADSGMVGADVEMTGFAVINGAVWIDGVKIHQPQSVYISKKSGKTYRIYWGKNDNVSVAEE